MKRIILFVLIFRAGCLFAQQTLPADNTAVEYLHGIGTQSVLYYGKQQEGHPRTSNHPYLNDAKYATARLSYCGIIYPGAMLRLDLNRNELIILSPNYHNIVLFPENVDCAELHGKHIIYFLRDSLPGCPSTGYYFMLHSGNFRVLEKQTATLSVKNSGNTALENYFSFKTNFYLYKDGVYHTVRGKGGLLKVLYPYRKELKQFISAGRLSFRRNAEEFLVRTVSEYEKLSGL